jgi:hypothetical protein
MELDLILERLREATGQKNNSAMAKYLGFRASAAGDWKKTKGIPYPACLAAAKKTGYTMEWFISGNEPKKHGDPVPFNIDEQQTIKTFTTLLVDCVEFKVVDRGQNWNEETINMMGQKFYNKFIGLASISEQKDKRKTA